MLTNYLGDSKLPSRRSIMAGKSRWKHQPTRIINGKTTYERTYFCWRNMKARCNNPKLPEYPYYGGRGISYCERWSSYDNFVDDMGLQQPGLQLDRIDTNGDYEPNNCRWATRSQNQKNRRDAYIVEWRGRTQHLQEWSKEVGLSYECLRGRIFRNKWPIEKAMTYKKHAHCGRD